MSQSLATVAYLGAAILFVLSLGGLSNPETSRRGNLFGMIGMVLAVLATVFGPRVSPAGIAWIVGALVIGGGIGLYAAKTVKMTQMPELVALMHSLVGLAACLVGFASYVDTSLHFHGAEQTIHEVEIYVGILIGAITFSGSLHEPGPLLAAVCFLLIAILSYKRVFGAILISIIGVTLAGWGLGLVKFGGVMSMPPSLAPTWMAMDVAGVFNVSMISVVLAFLFVHMFDTAGTLMGVAQRANLVAPDGRIEGLSRALKADSASSVFGAVVGVPPVTSYVESAAGVAAGGRTGLTAVVVGLLFVAAMFFAPLAGMIPAYATAGALIYVAMLMMGSMAHIHWDEATDSIPAIVTVIMMPLTFSVADGIALGFITYVALKAGTGKYKEISASLWVLCAIFIAKFVFL